MEEMITQKIAHLRDVLEKQESNLGTVLRTFHDLFQFTHEGRDLSFESLDWLNQTARLFLSPALFAVLFKLHLEVYAFHFAALNFTEIDDVIDDISNGDFLKHTIPPGAFHKLKKELIKPLARNYLEPVMDMSPCKDTKIYKSSDYSGSSLSPCPQQVMVPKVQLPSIGTKFDVKVISVVDPSNFYVLPLENLPNLITLSRQLKDAQQFGDVGCDWIVTGKFYIRWCSELEEFKRVRVLKKVGETAEIFNIDEGGVQLVNIDDGNFYYLAPKFAKLPAQAIRAKLYGVKPNNNKKWSDENVLFFKKSVMEETKTFAANVMGILPNEALILQLNQVSIAQVLIDNVHASSSLA